MTSWTLDNTTFHYWTLSETGEIVWGYPKHGDEVIIDDRFKYIFKVTRSETDKISEGWEEIRYTSSGFTPTNYNRVYVLPNDLASNLDHDQANEIAIYMREAQQMMNNGR